MSDELLDIDDEDDAPAQPHKQLRPVKKLHTKPQAVAEPKPVAKPVAKTEDPVGRKVLRHQSSKKPVAKGWPAPTEVKFEAVLSDDDEEEVYEDDSPQAANLTEPAELQTLPDPSAISGGGEAPIPVGAPLPAAAGGNKIDANKHWDDFLLGLSRQTLIAVYEMGVDSLTAFTQYSKSDLQRPRGRLTEEQATEIEEILNTYGVKLSLTSRRSGALSIRGGQQRLGGMRVKSKEQAPLPADATVAQQRTHRLTQNRLTM